MSILNPFISLFLGDYSMSGKEQIGTLVVTERSTKTTYPVRKAIFGIYQYTDVTEIWLLVSAGTADSNGENDDDREPRMAATIYDENIDPSHLSKLELEIPDPVEHRRRIPDEAQFYYFAHPGKPEDIVSGRIQFQQSVGKGYQVHWTATLDAYNRPAEPGSQIELELDATFQPHHIVNIPYPLKDTYDGPERWFPFLILPMFLLFVLMCDHFPKFRILWMIVFYASVLVLIIATVRPIYRRNQIERLKSGNDRNPQ